MKSPFYNIDCAFAPFFDDAITIKTPDGKSGTFSACLFTDGTSDPLTDDMMETNREDITFVFRNKDWPFVKNLQRGAIVRRLVNNKEYSVSEAKYDNALGWIVAAREM